MRGVAARAYQRDYARRRREAKHAAKLAGAHRCPFKLGPSVCNGALRIDTDGRGGTLVSCDWCDRRKRGICRDCGARVVGQVGRALRCEVHKRLRAAESFTRYAEQNRSTLRKKARAYARRPAVRAKRLEYKKLYRAAYPSKVKRWKAKEAATPNAKRDAYHRDYYQKNGTRHAGVHFCLGCGTTLTGRPKKCEPCRLAAKQTAKAVLLQGWAA